MNIITANTKAPLEEESIEVVINLPVPRRTLEHLTKHISRHDTGKGKTKHSTSICLCRVGSLNTTQTFTAPTLGNKRKKSTAHYLTPATLLFPMWLLWFLLLT